MQQPIRMMNLQISSDAFGTEAAFVNWKIVSWLDADHMIVFDQEIHPALHGAVRTMGRHNTIDHSIRAPAVIRCIMQMWTVSFDDLIQMFDFTHSEVLDP